LIRCKLRRGLQDFECLNRIVGAARFVQAVLDRLLNLSVVGTDFDDARRLAQLWADNPVLHSPIPGCGVSP